MGMVHIVSGAKVSKVEVMTAARLTVDCSSEEGRGLVVSCALSCPVRWFRICSGFMLYSLHDSTIRAGG